MRDSTTWYWTPGRLRLLGELLRGVAGRDDVGCYFATLGIRRYVADNGRRVGLDLSIGQADMGLAILVFLEALEPGIPGRYRPPGYKRRFYYERVASITNTDIQNFRESRGRKGPLPPPR